MNTEESSLTSSEAFREFGLRLKTLFSKNPSLISLTLSNIFTMRLIGNKTHGDLAEIAIAEFINQYMYDYKSLHVGKDLFRAKTNEEDITILSEITGASFPVSLKAYGDGPLQLSTDKSSKLFPLLELHQVKLNTPKAIIEFLQRPEFEAFFANNTLPLIYNEKKKRCNILIFDKAKVLIHIHSMRYESVGKGRKHPVFRFYDAENPILVRLFSHALVASERGHSVALEQLKADITQLKREYPFQ